MGRFVINPEQIKLECAKKLRAESLSLSEYYQIRKKVLFARSIGNIGDILMLRMLFEDFKTYCSDMYLVVAIPSLYHDLMKGHPFIDEVVDYHKINIEDYWVSYDLSNACLKREIQTAPFGTEHRSDIWTEHCGLSLNKHDMHLSVDTDITNSCRQYLESIRGDDSRPIVLFTPKASADSRSLDDDQTQGVIDGLIDLGLFPIIINAKPLKFETPTIVAQTLSQFLGFINASDYIITVDTGVFHAAGGFKKPTVAIFAWTDGKVYGKWFDNFILVQRHRDNGDWACGPCYYWHSCKYKGERKPCITSITPQEIIEATKEMMNRWRLEGDDGTAY